MSALSYTHYLFLILVILLSSGCQTVPKTNSNALNYGDYYLNLQNLTSEELQQEATELQRIIAEQSNGRVYHESQIKMLFLYSMSSSPVYNSYRAKALLNDIKNAGKNKALSKISSNDQALISLLRDQLNQKLLMRNRLLAQQKHQKIITKQNINNLSKQVKLLQKTIVQLKEIEQAINQRDQ